MAKKKADAKIGRPPREAFTEEGLQAVIAALNDRADKLAAIIVGMQAIGLNQIEISEAVAMKKGLDGIRGFCDDGLDVLRDRTQWGDRPWDKWER